MISIEKTEKFLNKIYLPLPYRIKNKRYSGSYISELKGFVSNLKNFFEIWKNDDIKVNLILPEDSHEKIKNRIKGLMSLTDNFIENFRKKDLLSVTLDKFESDTEKCYKSFENEIGKIASVKVLHLICPSFFPLWDNKIADAIRKVDVRNNENRRIAKFSEADYYQFMQKIQNFSKKHETILSDLADQYKKSKLKILDDFLWWAANRPLDLFFNR